MVLKPHTHIIVDLISKVIILLTIQNYKYLVMKVKAASILMSADDGDDNADHWRMYSNVDNSFTLNSYAGGSYQSILKGTSSESIELNYQGSKKLETTSAGIDISGNLTLPTTDAKIQLKDGNNYIQFVNADKNFKFMNVGVLENLLFM